MMKRYVMSVSCGMLKLNLDNDLYGYWKDRQ
jgi:hypothetical protein